MKLLKNNVFNGIILALAFSFNILFFAPLEMYFTNKTDLWFSQGSILLISIPLTIVVTAVLAVILIKCNKKKKKVFQRIIAIVLTGLYIQGNFLNFGYGVLDGSDIDWLAMTIKGLINTAIWLALILFPFEIKKLKTQKGFRTYTSILSLYILGVELVTLTTLQITNIGDRTSKVLVNNNILNLSKDNNIVIFMADTFEGTYMNQILEDHPEFKEKLKDFTYFDNASSISFYTFSSLPTMMTGVQCKVGNTLDENLDYCFNNTKVYDILKQNNYSPELYVESALKPNSDKIDNLVANKKKVKLNSNIEINKTMYKAVLYRYLPHFLKASFVVSGDDFSRIQTKNKEETDYKESAYTMDDVAFNEYLTKNGIETKMSAKSFKFFELDGMHRPYETKEDITYDKSDDYMINTPQEERRMAEGVAALNLLCNYVEELKKSGVYDNTNIIFLADHGYSNRFYVNLLVKRAGDNHDFTINSAPVSTLTDLIPTVLNMATESKDYGKDFFDFQEDEVRTRQVLDYTYQESVWGLNEHTVISKMTFESNENVKNEDSFKVIDEEYKYDKKELTEKYDFGEIVETKNIPGSNCINIKGITLDKINASASIGNNINKHVYITVNRKKAENDVIANLNISKVYGNGQKVNVRMNNELISSDTLFQKVFGSNLTFTIPKEEWNLKEQAVIELEFPNAVLGEQEFTMMIAIKLKSLKFSEAE